MTDRELLAACAASGKPEAFEAIVERHAGMVYRTCLRVLGRPAEAEDAAQAAFLLLLRKARGLSAGTQLSGWLFLTALAVARNARRQVLRRERREKEAAAMRRSEQGATESREGLLPLLDEALMALPGAQREALVLRYLRGLSEAEACRELGCPQSTLATRVARGLERLRAVLGRKDVSVSAAALGGLLAEGAAQPAPAALVATLKGMGAAASAASATATSLAEGTMKAMVMVKVKLAAAVVCAAAVVGTGGGLAVKHLAASGGEPVKSEPAAASALELPEKLKAAPPNTWAMLNAGGYGGRDGAGLVYLPEERRFLILGGSMGGKGSPYSEMALNLKESRWENRFPPGKEGVWGDVTGPARPWSAKWRGPGFEADEGILRPHLNNAEVNGIDMGVFGNAVYDAARGRVVVSFHGIGQTYEYDVKARAWQPAAVADQAPGDFWTDVIFGAMCYDPVNKEVLGGQYRRVWRNGKWEKLQLGSKPVNDLRGKAEALALSVRKLVGACRARFYLTESESMAKARLDETAAALGKDIGALAAELAGSAGKASDYEKKQFGWAAEDLGRAAGCLAKAQEPLKNKMTAEGIAAVEDAWEALDNVVMEDLAVFPPKRAFSQPALDNKRGKIVVFGGHRLDRVMGDTWVYDCKARIWEQRRPKLSPAPRHGHGLAWLPDSGRVLLVDGSTACRSLTGVVAETWTYDLDTDEWMLLAEGGGPRDSLTAYPSVYSGAPEPSAAGPGDVVITISNRKESKVPRCSTWATRIDVTKTDAAGTAKRGVPFRAESIAGKIDGNDPRWFEQNAGDVAAAAAAQQEWIEKLPANTWALRDPKTQPNKGGGGRDFSTAAYDPDGDQLLLWGGGHVAYDGNCVWHYSLKSNRFYAGLRPEWGLCFGISCEPGNPMAASYRNRANMTVHPYHSYAYDQPSGKLLVCGQISGRPSVKDPLYFCYDPAATEWFPGPILSPFASAGANKLYATSKGVIAWANGAFWRPDVAGLKWEKLPHSGAELGIGGFEAGGFAHDTKRERLLLFSQHLQGKVGAYDLKTGQASTLSPAGAGAPAFLKGGDDGLPCRELVYVPDFDAVLVAARVPEAGGKRRWLVYDCQNNAWKAALLGGNDPIQENTGGAYSWNLGLVYDAKRKLIWATQNSNMIYALRLDLKTADLKPLEGAAPAPPAKK